jgi:transcriptional regulator with XRE-family HTH domain
MEDSENIVARLDKFRVRGRINADHIRQEVEEALSPLPPPWRWQSLRELAGLTISQMARLSGFKGNNIHRWERGQGTQRGRDWVHYAIVLVKAVSEALQQSEEQSLALVEQQNQTGGDVSPLVQDYASRNLRSAHLPALFWIEQENLPFSNADALLLADELYKAARNLRRAERSLRNRVIAVTPRNEEEEVSSNG